jgi:hypothetical protein
MKAELQELIEDFFDAHILDTFPDENGAHLLQSLRIATNRRGGADDVAGAP